MGSSSVYRRSSVSSSSAYRSVSNYAWVAETVYARLVECCPSRRSDDIAFAASALSSYIWPGRCLDMTMAIISNLYASCASGAEWYLSRSAD